MNYNETLEFLFSQLPMFQRVGGVAYKSNLDITVTLDNFLGNPHKKYKTVHIGGTNGKGSVAHSLASVLQAQGYRVGLYTSPHYLDFRERIKVNGEKISKEFVVEFVENIKDIFGAINPSFFELTSAMAFSFFADRAVDIAVIEVGLGGRLDSTNIICPIVSVITNISYDHQQFLGDKLSLIATEKAGIIKRDVPVVIGETKAAIKKIFLTKSYQVDAPVYFSAHNFSVKRYELTADNNILFDIMKHNRDVFRGLIFGLSGEYQRHNILTILQTIELLREQISISDVSIYEGLRKVVENTGIMGRWQVLHKGPAVICDAGHNFAGILEVVRQIKRQKYNNLHVVFGVVRDKDISVILNLLPQRAMYYFTKANIVRALDADILRDEAKLHKLTGRSFGSVSSAIESALGSAQKDDFIFVGGSTFVAAEAIEFFGDIGLQG